MISTSHRLAGTGFAQAMAVVVYLLLHPLSVVALHYIRLTLAFVFLPRIPPRTFPLRQMKTSRYSTAGKASKSPCGCRSLADEEHIGVAPLESEADGAQHKNLASPMTNTPRARPRNKQLLMYDHPDSNVDFSIYADASSSNLNKARLIAPMVPQHVCSAMDDLSILRAASDRISEILRESRRRLDEGEDSSDTRKEARRKRAEELLSARNQLANLLG